MKVNRALNNFIGCLVKNQKLKSITNTFLYQMAWEIRIDSENYMARSVLRTDSKEYLAQYLRD